MTIIKIILVLGCFFFLSYLLSHLNAKTKKKKKLKSIKFDPTYVFDKAEYHVQAAKKLNLQKDQAFVHTAFFINWLTEKELFNLHETESAELKEKLLNKECDPCQIYKDRDGCFLGKDLTVEGYIFTMDYFNLDSGEYLADYQNIFLNSNDEIYSVKNTWDNYSKLKLYLDTKYVKWIKKSL